MMQKKIFYGIIVLLIVIALVLLFTFGIGIKHADLSKYDNTLVPQQFMNMLRVPDNISSAIGIGSTNSRPSRVNATPLLLNGKPEIFYVGSEYCPFCAAERWGLVTALMRFGNFSNLKFMTSSPTDYSPGTPTFTFVNSTYTSNYVSFVSVELTGNKAVNGTYPPLQHLNSSQNNIVSALNPQGSTPFVDYANRSVQIGANFDPQSVLLGKNWTVIENNLYNTSTLQAQAVIGTANLITAEICKGTNNQPSSVCSKQYIAQIEKNVA